MVLRIRRHAIKYYSAHNVDESSVVEGRRTENSKWQALARLSGRHQIVKAMRRMAMPALNCSWWLVLGSIT